MASILGLALHLDQLISCCQHISEQVVPAVASVGDGTNFASGIERAKHQVTTGPDMSRPWQDDIAKGLIGTSLKALQSPFFDQVTPELPEAESGLIVAKARSGHDGEPCIGQARAIAVAVLEAEVHHPANEK